MSRKKKKQIKAPVFFQNLSRPPDGAWPQRAFYHGTRVALLVLLAVAITFLFPSEGQRIPDPYQEGDVATADEAAEVGFDIPKDPEELERQQADAAAAGKKPSLRGRRCRYGAGRQELSMGRCRGGWLGRARWSRA